MTSSSYFSRIFGNSPVTPLQKHIAKVIACIDVLVPYFQAASEGDWIKAAELQAHIVELEHEADEIKNQLRVHLPTSLFMPIDRRDVLEVLNMQDQIANRAKDIAGLILGRKMSMPEAIQDTYMNFLARCIEAAQQAQIAINELDELVTSGFHGDETQRVTKMIGELHQIEAETDELQIKLRAKLYAIEAELSPVDVMFLYKIIEWTGKLADSAQSAGNRLQLMMAK